MSYDRLQKQKKDFKKYKSSRLSLYKDWPVDPISPTSYHKHMVGLHIPKVGNFYIYPTWKRLDSPAWTKGYTKQYYRVKVYFDPKGERALSVKDREIKYFPNAEKLDMLDYVVFDFWTPEHLLNNRDGHISALYCYLSDAISYANAEDIDDFQAEFGYEKVSECLQAYEGCEEAYRNLIELLKNEDLIYDSINKIQEIWNI